MALAFTGNMYVEADFLPSPEELSEYREKIKRMEEPCSPVKKIRTEKSRWHWDSWDERGRNLTEQEKRQAKVPWVKVKYVHGRLFIPEEKKSILVAMNLI